MMVGLALALALLVTVGYWLVVTIFVCAFVYAQGPLLCRVGQMFELQAVRS